MTAPRSSSVSNAEVFGAQRARLRVLAYRILGDMWDAEDAVQNAWLRFAETDLSTINDVDAWLTTVVSRAAIDVTRRRRTHQTLPVDDIAEPATPIDDPRADPERLILKDEQVAMAFTIVLRELSPVDRLSYMLHDVFGYPFAEIAEIAGSTVDVVKKRASRARQRLRDRDWDAIRQEQRREVVAFLAAARSGEMHDLIALLDPDVTLRADADAIALAASRQAENAPALTPKITGSDAVGDALSGRIDEAIIVEFAGLAAIAYWRDRKEIVALYVLTVGAGKVVQIDALADPATIRTALQTGMLSKP
ncbi:sigma-70 family RNA polymerase sigma factor [Microbacterium maritypicum]|uniref:Sigma-70 family RNA polymerase sigma factor n=1 Tax=Microbacterium maritypicum TaxID=33918 RepID=A0AAD3ZXR9_MICMQ|nr:sigma-70 family RNA polymerase sigma factor [Microbacterium liquefaciens]KAB1883513.1 sigma-70 family RNA polymerase sigma factor [Microbacterium liquefaciens]